MHLNAGQLDRRITLQQRTVTRDPAYNAEVVTWPDIATVWAKVVESSTAPGPGASGDVALYARPMKITIRWRAGIDKSTTRISYAGRLLRITGTAELGRREGIELACEEWAHE